MESDGHSSAPGTLDLLSADRLTSKQRKFFNFEGATLSQIAGISILRNCGTFCVCMFAVVFSRDQHCPLLAALLTCRSRYAPLSLSYSSPYSESREKEMKSNIILLGFSKYKLKTY